MRLPEFSMPRRGRLAFPSHGVYGESQLVVVNPRRWQLKSLTAGAREPLKTRHVLRYPAIRSKVDYRFFFSMGCRFSAIGVTQSLEVGQTGFANPAVITSLEGRKKAPRFSFDYIVYSWYFTDMLRNGVAVRIIESSLKTSEVVGFG